MVARKRVLSSGLIPTLQQQFLLIVLVLAVVTSAIGVAYSRNQVRSLFSELETLRHAGDELAVEWGRLQLEEATFATHGLIEKKARTRLNMVLPAHESVEYVRP